MSCAHGAVSLGSYTTVHLRLPAIEPGVKAFVWALLLSLYLWAFMLAANAKGPTTHSTASNRVGSWAVSLRRSAL